LTLSDHGPEKEWHASPEVAGAVLDVLLLPVAGALLAPTRARGWHFG
jgi:hypothetical protein